MEKHGLPAEPPTIQVRRSGGRRAALILLLVVVGLSGGGVIRMLMSSRSAQELGGAAGSSISSKATGLTRDASAIWKRLLTGLDLGSARRLLIDRPLRYLLGHGDLEAPRQAPAGAKRSGAPAARLSSLPNLSPEALEQRAAHLWQGGVLSTRQGDYSWAIQQFKSCLEAQPKHEECRKGLSEAERRLAWNRKTQAR
jgi:hypothetical protein